MIQGAISHEVANLDIDLLEALVLGSSSRAEPLVFRAPDGTAEIIRLPGDPAYSCESCNVFLIITDPEYNETECLVCRTVMPAGTASCPKCGWTYRES
jgi:hypothetical protein